MREDHKFEIERLELSQDRLSTTESWKARAEGAVTASARSLARPAGFERANRRPWGTLACLVGSLLVVLTMLGAPTVASARINIGVVVSFGPPALPYYVQPPCPGPGYIWTPGYWAWSPGYGYYWVPGTWVAAPFVGALWTPGYWDFDDGGYRWHRGYWGLSVGFYGGIDYGYGYTGFGYHGGYWNHDRFYYNRAVNRIIGRSFRHYYYRRVPEHFRERHISYHGGPGGIRIRPTRRQLAARRMRRFGPVREQMRQERFARRDPAQRWRVNHGRPAVAATRRPGEFRGFRNDRANRAGAPYREPRGRTMHSFRPEHSAPGRASNYRGAERPRSFGAQRSYAQPHGRVERRAPVQQGRYERPRVQRSSPRQARRQEARQPRHYAQARHGRPQHQKDQKSGKDHGGKDHGRGQGGRR